LIPNRTDPNYFRKSDSYKDATWIDDYFKEIVSSYNSSWRPYVYWRRTPYQGKYININDQGIRDTSPGEVSDGEATVKLKLFMFGGSTLWGEGVRDQYTIPSLVGKDLAVHKIKAEITNFGEVAYVNTQELIELILQLERGNIPDIVIFYDGYNDVYAALQNGVAGFPQFEWRRKAEYNISTSRYVNLRRVFLLNSLNRLYLGKFIKSLADKLNVKKPFTEKSKTLEKDIIEVYLNNIKIIDALGKAYGFVPLFYWQPVIYTKNNLTNFEKDFATEPLGALHHKSHAVMKANYAEFARYHFADISGLFAEATNPVYLDYCHVNEDANKIIAARIAGDLLKIIGSPSATGRPRISGRAAPP
jgi:lysophospholipase L1-like esterase